MTDHNWVPVSARMPHDGQLVALRMMESIHKDVHYAIGWYSEEQHNWVITAHPKTDAYLEVIACLGGQFKSGQLGSDQNRPTEVARNC